MWTLLCSTSGQKTLSWLKFGISKSRRAEVTHSIRPQELKALLFVRIIFHWEKEPQTILERTFLLFFLTLSDYHHASTPKKRKRNKMQEKDEATSSKRISSDSDGDNHMEENPGVDTDIAVKVLLKRNFGYPFFPFIK